MRILHVITSLYTGGAEMLVVNSIPRFRDLGHDVGVAVFNGKRTALMERLERECPDCKIYKLGNSFYNPWYIFKLLNIIKKFDIIHAHVSSPQLYVSIANLFCHKKLVTTEHSTNNRKRNNFVFSLVDMWMYSQYDRIICISNQAEANLKDYLRNESIKSRILTICNGIDIKHFYNAKPLDEFGNKKFIIVMVAAFRPEKDHETLIKAMKILPKDIYEVWLVGDGECLHQIKELTNRLNVCDCVKFLGTRLDVPNILKTADVVVLSTHYEGLSLSNIEGMAAGKPFVASDVQGVREVTANYGILVPPQDPESLANVIQELHDNKSFYLEVANRCYERAKQFDISEMVKLYDEVYMSLTYGT